MQLSGDDYKDLSPPKAGKHINTAEISKDGCTWLSTWFATAGRLVADSVLTWFGGAHLQA